MRIFLDANILFSAAKSAGAVRELLARARAAGRILYADEYVVAEARRNLQAKAPAAMAAFETLLTQIRIAAFQANDLAPDVAGRLPEKDRPVLAAAIRLKCDALVTGDRTHFGALYGRSVSNVAIHSPRSLADVLAV
jgi:predicted nucleic acid-binding protein